MAMMLAAVTMIIENRNKPPYHSAASTPDGSRRNVGKQQSLVFLPSAFAPGWAAWDERRGRHDYAVNRGCKPVQETALYQAVNKHALRMAQKTARDVCLHKQQRWHSRRGRS